MGSVNWKDVAARAAKTAVATFIGLVPASELLNGTLAAEQAAGIAAASAAITVVWNVLLDWSRDE